MTPTLRRATPQDMRMGQQLLYRGDDDIGLFIATVEEVLRPDDDWKAYMFEGSRYGLEGAYVVEGL